MGDPQAREEFIGMARTLGWGRFYGGPHNGKESVGIPKMVANPQDRFIGVARSPGSPHMARGPPTLQHGSLFVWSVDLVR